MSAAQQLADTGGAAERLVCCGERGDSEFSQGITITCAVTGAIHTPSISPHSPITTQEIAEAAIEVA
jgi:beta-keto acid cleavage enzyme